MALEQSRQPAIARWTCVVRGFFFLCRPSARVPRENYSRQCSIPQSVSVKCTPCPVESPVAVGHAHAVLQAIPEATQAQLGSRNPDCGPLSHVWGQRWN